MRKFLNFDRRLIPLLFIIFLDALGFGIAFPILTPLIIQNSTHMLAVTSNIQTRNFWFEIVIAAYCVLMFINSPILGSLSDRFGRKKILMLSLLGLAAGYVFMAWGIWRNSLSLIILGRVVSGATAGSYPVAQAGVVDISSEKNKAASLGLVAMANGVGFAFGPVVGGIFLDARLWHTVNYQSPFWLFAVLAFLGIFIIHYFYQDTVAGNPEQKIHVLTSFYNMRDAFVAKNIRIFCIALLFFMIGYCIFFTSVPVFVTEYFHKSGDWLGYFLTYFAIIFSLSLLILLPQVTSKYSLHILVIGGLITQIIFNSVFILSQNTWLLWIFVLPIATAVPITYVAMLTLLSNSADNQNQGKIMGIAGSITALAWGIGPLFAGVLGKLSLTASYISSLVLLLIAGLLMIKPHGDIKKVYSQN